MWRVIEKNNLMNSFNPRIKKYLDRLTDSSKSPNSFLFAGTEGTGKVEAAYYFISKLAGRDGDAAFRKKIEKNIHPDVVIVEPVIEEKKGKKREKEIGISQVKEARERLKFFPYELKKKFCLIKHADRLNREASNALLKVLEEPSADAYFILLASSLDAMLPTIQSRCAIFRFPQTEIPKLNDDHRQSLRKIFAGEVYQRFEYIEEKSKDRHEIISILKDWEQVMAESLRKLIMTHGDKDSLADRAKIRKVIELVENTREAINRLEYTNANARGVGEKLMLNI